MALNEQEKSNILKWNSEGKTTNQIMGLIGAQRAGAIPSDYISPNIEIANQFESFRKNNQGVSFLRGEGSSFRDDFLADLKETGSNLFGTLKTGGQEIIQEAQTSEDVGLPRAGLRTAGKMAKTFTNAIGDLIGGAGRAFASQEREEAFQQKLVDLVNAEIAPAIGIGSLSDIGGGAMVAAQETADNLGISEELQKDIGAIAEVGEGIATIATGGAAAGVTRKGLSAAVDTTKKQALNMKNALDKQVARRALLAENFKADTPQAMDNVQLFSGDLRERMQSFVGSRNVEGQTEASFKRYLEGVENRGDALGLYDEYVPLAKSAVGDIKNDPPISMIGNEMGDQFKSIIEKRREIGQIMGSEITKAKGTKVSILPAIDNYVEKLSEQGVVYDRVKRQIDVKATEGTSLANADVALLQNFGQELQKLGSNPSALALDNAIKKINADTKISKQTQGITSVTNGERIMISVLDDMVENLKKTPGLERYAEARQTYSDLSNFIQEGEKHLGKLTQSGDFARDASILKSSVQSVLNNGKKDWLIQLEELTGYPALDKSVIALQAMKDAGDSRGISLLERVAEGSVPTSKGQVMDRFIDFAFNKTTGAVVGSPEDTTRAFLKSLSNQQGQ